MFALAHLRMCAIVRNDTPPSLNCTGISLSRLTTIYMCTQYLRMNNEHHPTIITFASPKGGAGKSTCCLSIAGGLLAKGKTVHIVDFDPSETLWRWHSTNDEAKCIPGLTVQKAPSSELDKFVKDTWYHPVDYVLIDLAGQLTREMLHMAVYAAVTITPVKISEPDIVEANKLHLQLREIQKRVSKKIIHRLLVNDVQPMLGGFERALLNELETAALPRFSSILRHRMAYGETFMTGKPPHLADQSRPPIAKATAEIDELITEIEALIARENGEGTDTEQQRVAA